MSYRVYSALSDRVRWFRANVLAPDRRTNPWARLACRLLGIALLASLIGLGMLLYSGMVVLSAIYRLLGGKPPVAPSTKEGQVMDGQYRVVEKPEPQAVRKEF